MRPTLAQLRARLRRLEAGEERARRRRAAHALRLGDTADTHPAWKRRQTLLHSAEARVRHRAGRLEDARAALEAAEIDQRRKHAQSAEAKKAAWRARMKKDGYL